MVTLLIFLVVFILGGFIYNKKVNAFNAAHKDAIDTIWENARKSSQLNLYVMHEERKECYNDLS